MKQGVFFIYLAACLVAIQGCSGPGYRSATPYRQKYETQQETGYSEAEEDMASRRSGGSVVMRIRAQAWQLMEDGELDAASQSIERGLRIAPKDEFLWSQLAQVRLEQQDYEQARYLAAKSSDLAGRNVSLISKNREIILEADRLSLQQ